MLKIQPREIKFRIYLFVFDIIFIISVPNLRDEDVLQGSLKN